ncbi:MAG TPA: NAD(+)/NADH kinase [Acidimicrobiales bacterium]|nr:NAD(+)/NADH kinase [Acidimicrobiales bacterium]
MAVVTLVLHPQRPQAVELGREAVAWLRERGHRVVVPKEDGAPVLEGAQPAGPDDAIDGADLAVSLGGDGTMLRTVQMAAGKGVPVLGVNLGQLGYLTSVEPTRLCEALDGFLNGSYVVDERLALQVRVRRAGSGAGPSNGGPHLTALNEAVLEKTVPGHTVHLGLSLAGEPFMTYAADGLIVSTPTGSTAYNLSARGPILSPNLRALLVTPVSPHMLFDRSLVLDPDTLVSVEILSERPAVLVVDGGEAGVLNPGDVVDCRAAPRAVRLVRFGEHIGFHAILKSKFGLSDR